MAEARIEAVITARDEASAKLTRFQRKLKSVGTTATRVGRQLTLSVTAPLAILGGLTLRTAVGFDKINRAVLGTAKASGATGEELEQLTELMLEFGTKGVFAPTEVAEAMLDMVRDGMKPAEIAGGRLVAVYDLAAASGSTMAQVQILLSDTLQGMGLRMEDTTDVVDAFSAVIFRTPATLENLAETMKFVGPVAGSLGIGIKELSLVMGVMAGSSIRGGIAGTALRRGLINLTAPAGRAEEAMKGLGASQEEIAALMGEVEVNAEAQAAALKSVNLEVFDSQGKFVGLRRIVDQLRFSLADATDQTKAQTVSAIFGARALAAWTTVINATDETITNLEDALMETGIATRIAAFRTQGLSGEMAKLKAQTEAAQIRFVSALTPAIIAVTKFITKLIKAFGDLSPKTQKIIGLVAVLAGAIGPLLIVFGLMANGIVAVAGAMGALTIASLPLIATIAIVAAAIAVIVAVILNWDEVIDFVSDQMLKFSDLVAKVWQTISNFTKAIWGDISDFFSQTLGGIVIIAKEDITLISNLLDDKMQLIKDTWMTAWTGIKNFFVGIWDTIKAKIADSVAFVERQVERVKSLIESARRAAAAPIRVVTGGISRIGGFLGLQDGGIVTRPTLARIGEAGPEAVVPLGRLAGLGGTNITININGSVFADDADILGTEIGNAIINRLGLNMRIG